MSEETYSQPPENQFRVCAMGTNILVSHAEPIKLGLSPTEAAGLAAELLAAIVIIDDAEKLDVGRLSFDDMRDWVSAILEREKERRDLTRGSRVSQSQSGANQIYLRPPTTSQAPPVVAPQHSSRGRVVAVGETADEPEREKQTKEHQPKQRFREPAKVPSIYLAEGEQLEALLSSLSPEQVAEYRKMREHFDGLKDDGKDADDASQDETA